MRRLAVILFPIFLVVLIWALAAQSNKPASGARSHSVQSEPAHSGMTEAAASEPLSNDVPTITATPRPPRRIASADLTPEVSAAASNEQTTVAESAPVLRDELTAKPIYTPRPPRGAMKVVPGGSTVQAEVAVPAAMAAGEPAMAAPAMAAAPITPGSKAVRQGPHTSMSVALTFDDGPNPTYTPELLHYLKENNIPATFFLLGENIEKNKPIVIEMAELGFEIGNHSYDHADLSKADEQKIVLQLKNTSDLIEQATGVRPVLMRPPYGATGKTMYRICEEMNLNVVLWSVDTNDWKQKSADSVLPVVEKELQGGAIVLMHDRLSITMDEVKRVVELVKQRGYKFVTVSELIHEINGGVPASRALPSVAAAQ